MKYIVMNDAGEYFVGFAKATGFGKSNRLGGYEPKFISFSSPGISIQLMDESELSEMESDLKKFNITYRLIEVNS